MSACNTCGGQGDAPAAVSDPHTASSSVDESEAVDGEEEFSLSKHDWNGIRVNMTEGQVRTSLKQTGFGLIPTRKMAFLTFDPVLQIMHVWKKDEDLSSIVLMETRRNERVLKNVWGVHFVFIKNRLFQFSPQYFAGPVELVEPDDEYVLPNDMENKLRRTFGTPNVLDGKLDVVYPDERGKKNERSCIWADKTLTVIFRRINDSGIERYSLVFVSPEGMKSVEKYLGRSLKSTKKRSDLEEITF
ncbi:MAG: hypothetical protein ABIJ56_21805 [Pseudomonadota bacterium]